MPDEGLKKIKSFAIMGRPVYIWVFEINLHAK